MGAVDEALPIALGDALQVSGGLLKQSENCVHKRINHLKRGTSKMLSIIFVDWIQLSWNSYNDRYTELLVNIPCYLVGICNIYSSGNLHNNKSEYQEDGGSQ